MPTSTNIELMFDALPGRGVISAALVAPPGPDVIAALDRVDAARLDPVAAADLLVAWERQAAWVASRSCDAVALVAGAARVLERNEPSADAALRERALQCEVAAAIRMSELTAGGRIMVADQLSGRLSLVADVLRAGDITYWHATAICEGVADLPDELAVWVAHRVLQRARRQTLSQLRASLRRAVMRAAPGRIRRDAEKARCEQDVTWSALPDGQAELRMTAGAADVLAVYKLVQDAARKLGAIEKTCELSRSAGQLRVAALLALVTGTTTADFAGSDGGAVAARPYQVTVNVTMDLPTLLGLRDNPAELPGYGSLPPSIARGLAADGAWRRLIHAPTSGEVLDLGRLRYRPSAALADYVRTRDVTCIFPTCTRRAETCDLDHAIPHRPDGSGGATDRHNLHALCAKHHRIKHETGWTLRTSDTGPPVWISPFGRALSRRAVRLPAPRRHRLRYPRRTRST